MASKPKPFDYRVKSMELDEIIAGLQNPEVQVDEATKLHAAGLKLVDEIEEYLNQAEIEVKRHLAE
jgi:exodeoxyribonuclease VII small subunit